jgi:hypothetical protein
VLRQPAELKPMGMVVAAGAAWFPLTRPFSNLSVADFLVRRPGRPDFFFTSTLRRRLKNIELDQSKQLWYIKLAA